MKNVGIPTHKDIYMISFLVSRGWEPDWDCERWKKDGHSYKIMVSKHDKHGYFREEEEIEWFELEDAFWEEHG
jgi:hypothetical protein